LIVAVGVEERQHDDLAPLGGHPDDVTAVAHELKVRSHDPSWRIAANVLPARRWVVDRGTGAASSCGAAELHDADPEHRSDDDSGSEQDAKVLHS
jgi:hypothetical protein